jgi:hypothetical protein
MDGRKMKNSGLLAWDYISLRSTAYSIRNLINQLTPC